MDSLKYSSTPYFSDYVDIMDGIVEDLASFALAYVAGEQLSEIEKMKEIASLPIYRGYREEDNGKQYVDSYLYEGKVYTENELTNLLKDKEVPVIVAYPSNKEEGGVDDIEPFMMGVGELFYYKNGPDGMKDYFEPNEPEDDREM